MLLTWVSVGFILLSFFLKSCLGLKFWKNVLSTFFHLTFEIQRIAQKTQFLIWRSNIYEECLRRRLEKYSTWLQEGREAVSLTWLRRRIEEYPTWQRGGYVNEHSGLRMKYIIYIFIQALHTRLIFLGVSQVWIQRFPSSRLFATPSLKILVCPSIYP